MKAQRRHPVWVSVAVAVALVVLAGVSLFLGARTDEFAGASLGGKVSTMLSAVGKGIRGGDLKGMELILWVRLSRIVLGMLVGVCLAGSGVIMQALFRNPMADPYILGISSGALLGVTVGRLAGVGTGVGVLSAQSVLAFAGAIGLVGAVALLSGRGRRLHITALLLNGIALGSLALAVAWAIMFVTAYTHEEILFLMLGTLSNRDWSAVGMVLPGCVVAFALTRLCARDLNLLLMGEETAQHLGLRPETMKGVLLALSALFAALAVAAVGIVGFVGLVVPHVMRLIVGPDHRALLPAASLGGAFLLIVSDDVTRLAGEMIPIGVVTSVFGCPFFLYLLARRERQFF